MSQQNHSNLSSVTQEYLRTYRCILNTMIQNMTNARLTNSISYNFIAQMLPHHRAAIDMCYNLLKYTTNIPLENIASCIILEQTESIEAMQRIACDSRAYTNCERDLRSYQRTTDCILDTMFTAMQNACAENGINANFIREMIPHHRGAVEMCKNALQYNIYSGLTPILENIIRTQERGICQLEELLDQVQC